VGTSCCKFVHSILTTQINQQLKLHWAESLKHEHHKINECKDDTKPQPDASSPVRQNMATTQLVQLERVVKQEEVLETKATKQPKPLCDVKRDPDQPSAAREDNAGDTKPETQPDKGYPFKVIVTRHEDHIKAEEVPSKASCAPSVGASDTTKATKPKWPRGRHTIVASVRQEVAAIASSQSVPPCPHVDAKSAAEQLLQDTRVNRSKTSAWHEQARGTR
jgi:hypothetical protein